MEENIFENMHDLDILGNRDQCGTPLIQTRGYWLPPVIVQDWLRTYNMAIRSDDVIVASSPKSGTHWLFYVVYLLKTNNFGAIPRHQQRPLLEAPRSDDEFQALIQQKEPRILATHMPAALLAKHAFKAKIVYIYRNPKDVVTSLYFHYKNFIVWPFNKTFEEFVDIFLEGDTIWGPHWKHVKSYHDLKQQGPNEQSQQLLLVKYEDLKKDTKAMIRKIGDFLQNNNLTSDFIDQIDEAVSIGKMRNNKDANGQIWRSVCLPNLIFISY